MRTLITLAALAALAAGCATAPTPVDASFGSAVNRAKAQQVTDPDAPSRQRPQLRQDGAAARSAVDTYESSYKQPQALPSVLNTEVGTGR